MSLSFVHVPLRLQEPSPQLCRTNYLLLISIWSDVMKTWRRLAWSINFPLLSPVYRGACTLYSHCGKWLARKRCLEAGWLLKGAVRHDHVFRTSLSPSALPLCSPPFSFPHPLYIMTWHFSPTSHSIRITVLPSPFSVLDPTTPHKDSVVCYVTWVLCSVNSLRTPFSVTLLCRKKI